MINAADAFIFIYYVVKSNINARRKEKKKKKTHNKIYTLSGCSRILLAAIYEERKNIYLDNLLCVWGHYTDAFGSYKVGGVGGLETAGPGLLWRLRSVGYFPFIYLFSFFLLFFACLYPSDSLSCCCCCCFFRSITFMFNL